MQHWSLINNQPPIISYKKGKFVKDVLEQKYHLKVIMQHDNKCHMAWGSISYCLCRVISAQSYQAAKTSSCKRFEEQKRWFENRLVYLPEPANLPVLQAIGHKIEEQ